MSERRSPEFQPWGLEGIRAGRKTMTRRAMNPQPHPDFLARGVVRVVPQWPEQNGVRWFMADGLSELTACPHGQPGTVWALREPLIPCAGIVYLDGTVVVDRRNGRKPIPWGWKAHRITARFMPAWAARDYLTLKAVRVERLQAISITDCLAEGIDLDADYNDYGSGGKHRDTFAALWDSINGKKHPWESNPWVWVYVFGDYVRQPGRPMEKRS